MTTFWRQGIHATWNEQTRTIEVGYSGDGDPTRATAAQLAAWVDGASGGAPFCVLADVRNMTRSSAGFRAGVLPHLPGFVPRATVACYPLDERAQRILDVFTMLGGLRFRSFATREEAEAFLVATRAALTGPGEGASSRPSGNVGSSPGTKA